MTSPEDAADDRPIHIGGLSFDTYQSAARHLIALPNQLHIIGRVFLPVVVGGLRDLEGYKREWLLLKEPAESRAKVIERYTNSKATPNGVEVEGAPWRFADINVHAENPQSNLLNWGIVYVRISENEEPMLHANIKPGHGITDASELAARLMQAEERAGQLIGAILRSEESIPFVH